MKSFWAARRRLFPRIILFLLLVLLLLWAADMGWHAYRLQRTLRQIPRDAAQASQLSVPQVQQWVGQSADDLAALRRDLRPFYPLLGWLGRDKLAGSVEPLLAFGAEAADGARQILQVAGPAWTGAETADGLNQRLLAQVAAHPDVLQAAAQAFTRADQARSRVNAAALPQRYQALYRQVDQAFPLALIGMQLLQQAPTLAGHEKPQVYLVLAQNRDELRATGGFITGIGTLQVSQGKVARFSIGDSYAVDDFSKFYPLPPEPIQRFMLGGMWLARDANWSPDFPTSARKAQELFTLSTGQQTHGVVAFDQAAVRGLLDVLGPVQVGDAAVTAAEVERYMQAAWAPQPAEGFSKAWWLQRKSFMGDLGRAMLQQVLLVRSPSRWMSLADTAVGLIRAGHLLIYFNDPPAQAALESAGLSGGAAAPVGDYLFWVDSNIGFNKVDAVLQRELVYRVLLRDPQHVQAQIAARFVHPVQQQVPCRHEAQYGEQYTDLQARCYWDYWRVLTAPGTHLTDARAGSVPADWLLNRTAWSGPVEAQTAEGGAQEYAGLLVVPTAQERSVALTLALPAEVLRPLAGGGWEYRLRVQKQPGLAGLPFTLQVQPPAGCTFINPDGNWKPDASGILTWQNTLQQTHEFVLRFAPAY